MITSTQIINNYLIRRVTPHKSVNNSCLVSPLKFDTISFSGRKNINYEMKNLPDEAFPSIGLKNAMMMALSEPDNDKTVVDIHRDYYSKLLECTTLDEAKNLYPEFNSVINATNIDISGLGGQSTLRKVQAGKINGLTLDNISLEFLKKYCGEFIPAQTDYRNEYFGLTNKGINGVLKQLNIGMSKEYYALVSEQRKINSQKDTWNSEEKRKAQSEQAKKMYEERPEIKAKIGERAKENWKKPEYRDKTNSARTAATQTEEYKNKLSKSTKAAWQDSSYRKRVTEQIRERVKDPKYLERMSQIAKEKWQDPAYREKITQAATLRWQDPEYKKKVVASLAKVMASEEYRAKQSEITKKHWEEDENYRTLMSIVYSARTKAWEAHPYAKEAYREVLKDFPGARLAIDKENKGIPLTNEDKAIKRAYHKACDDKYPDLKREIGAIQKDILQQWGFYDEDRNLDEIIAKIEEIKQL